MIVDAIVSAFLSALSALLTLIPDVQLPDIQSSEITGGSFIGTAVDFNGIAPIWLLIKMIALSITIHLAMLVFELALWAFHQVWGSD